MYRGAHGTCGTCAEGIKSDGFVPSGVGLRGAGAYFYGYTLDPLEQSSERLAVGWYCFALRRGDYSKYADQSGRVLFVEFDVASEDVLDMEEIQVRDLFRQFCESLRHKLNCDSSDEEVSGAYDLFLAQTERNLGAAFKLVHVKVQPPPKMDRLLHRDLDMHACCFVAKSMECIRFVREKVIDHDQ